MDMDIDNSTSSTSSGGFKCIVCQLCGKYFTKNGINIHLARHHRSSQDSFPVSNISDHKEHNTPCGLKGVAEVTFSINSSPSDDASIPINESGSQGTSFSNAASFQFPLDAEGCPHCGKFFKGHRGVTIHISRAHPQEHREAITSRQPSWQKGGADEAQSAPQPDSTLPGTIPENGRERLPSVSPELRKYKDGLAEWKSKFTEADDDNTFCQKVTILVFFWLLQFIYYQDRSIPLCAIMKPVNGIRFETREEPIKILVIPKEHQRETKISVVKSMNMSARNFYIIISAGKP